MVEPSNLTDDRLRAFMLVVRQACLMIAAHIEREYGLQRAIDKRQR